MKAIKYLFLAALTIFALASCKKDHPQDEPQDEPQDQGIKIDGDMSDWDDIEGLTDEAGPVYAFKATYDDQYVYFYVKRSWNPALFPDPESASSKGGYFYFCLETDGNPETGVHTINDDPNHTYEEGIDSWFYAYLYTGSEIAPKIETAPSGGSYPDSFLANVVSGGKCREDQPIEIEVRANRSDLLIQAGQTVRIYTYGNKSGTNLQKKAIELKIEK